MSTVRVTAGILRGRAIHFNNKKFDSADITPQKVKGALFSMLQENLSERSFLDLFAGSGQIGIEALSRGAEPVVFVEKDKKRLSFITSFLESIDTESNTSIIHADNERALRLLHSRGETFDIIFCDPPYVKDSSSKIYTRLLAFIEKYPVLAKDGWIVIQHFKENKMPTQAGTFKQLKQKIYGTTTLTVYIAATSQ